MAPLTLPRFHEITLPEVQSEGRVWKSSASTSSFGSSAGLEGHLLEPYALLTLLATWCPQRTTVPSMHCSRALPALGRRPWYYNPQHALLQGSFLPMQRVVELYSPACLGSRAAHTCISGLCSVWTECLTVKWRPGRGDCALATKRTVWPQQGTCLLLSWVDPRLRVLKHGADRAAGKQCPLPILKTA